MTARHRLVAVTALAGVVFALSACAIPHSAGSAPQGVPSPTATASVGSPGADDLVVRVGGIEYRLADAGEEAYFGHVPDDAPVLSDDDVFVFVRQAGWGFWAEQRRLGGDCGGQTLEPVVTELGGGWYRVTPVGEAGEYELWLSAGSGPGLPLGGTVGAARGFVKWQTTASTPVETVAGLDVSAAEGEPARATLTVLHLGTVPVDVSATLTLRNDSGATDEFELNTPSWACDHPGDLTLAAEIDQGDVSALSGDGATYALTLVLDGVSHTASGDIASQQSAPLTFSPALP